MILTDFSDTKFLEPESVVMSVDGYRTACPATAPEQDEVKSAGACRAAPEGYDEILMDLNKIAELKQLDPDGSVGLLNRLVEIFVVKIGETLQKPCWSPGTLDLNAIGRTAHSMKSSSAALGAVRLSALCGALEKRIREGRAVDVFHYFIGIRSAYQDTVEALNQILTEADTQ
jgi:hypothetical protein